MEYASSTRHISTYCLSESSFKFHIENDYSLAIFSFVDLAKKNITSDDLYVWSTPIDIIEQYQIYLETNDVSLSKQIFYNCTLPRFGPMCQYELYYYHDNYSSLYEIIHGYYRSYVYNPTDLTCYTHLKCNRGYSPACLDWTEICDGKVDCLDGEYDEEHCWQLEFNECQPNEYQCTIGVCIPKEFTQDNLNDFYCIDQSDKNAQNLNNRLTIVNYEPTFEYEDIRCETTFLTSSCVRMRHYLLSKSMFSVKDISVSDKCWLALKCYFGLLHTNYVEITDDIIDKDCIITIKDTCPDILYTPNIPSFYGHIYTAFKKNAPDLPFLCSNKSFNYGSLNLVLDMSINNTMCYKISNAAGITIFYTANWLGRYETPMNDILRQIKENKPIINFPLNRCNESNIYQCKNSSKCISYNRLMNEIIDCPYSDDENIFGDTNSQLFTQIKHKYYKCYFTNKSIPQSAILNNNCDCGRLEDLFCEDEHEFENFTKRTISFQTICDGFQELYPIMIDGKNETDETQCEQWECDNMYTHCNGIWNCFYGEDEMDCDSSPPLFNCSAHERICITRDTSEFSCLPINKINDGTIDCLGGTDEQKLCPPTPINEQRRFYCMTSHSARCAKYLQLCNGHEDCLYGDDEQFCQKNRSMSMYTGICQNEYISLATDVEKFICSISTSVSKAPIKYFTVNGFHESSENKVIYENEQINVIILNNSKPIPLLNNSRCHRGLDLRVWLNKLSNRFTSTCLCPPTYYGKQCQFQNQRLSLAIAFRAPAQLRQIPFIILIVLIDNTNQRIIHSYEQFTYLSIRDCNIKFNVYLLYSTRPKRMNRTYSIHIDIYEKISLMYWGSFLYPVKFLFLPVHRLGFILDIPFTNDHQICSNIKCLHGRCLNYLNTKETFCQCENGWSGQYCHIPHHCTCSPSNSLCVGMLNNNRSICICRENYFGSKCYVRNRICDNNVPCENNGLCISHDDFMSSSSKQKYYCICPKGFSGSRCQVKDTELNLIFDKDIHLSHSIFIHFLKIIPINEYIPRIPKPSPSRSTTLQTISQSTNSIRIYWSHPFHLTFIETLDKIYYLTVIQPIHNYSTIVKRIDSSFRCPSINELVNETFSQLHVLRRMKSYHLICQQNSPTLQCFHDDIHLCLCYDHQHKRLANCFQFNHHMKFDCSGQNHCENDGQCFQDSPDCPKRTICACRSCYYGSRCQFTTSEFGLSLDAILAYHIIPNVNIFHQTSIVKLSFSFTILFMIVGLINGVLSFVTFRSKTVLEVGCGIYLLCSSMTTILITILFGMKYFIYLSTQISTPSNQSFLKFQCYSFDFLLRICLNMDQWLNACVSMERAFTVIQDIQFVKKKSKQLAKKVIIILFILITLTSIHDPIHRRLFEEEDNDNENGKRIWCIVNFSSKLRTYNRIVNTFLFFIPFLINLISSIIIITKTSRRQSRLRKYRSYKVMLYEQIRNHQHLFVAPVVLFALALPRLILSYASKCMNSSKDSWIFLSGYFISFIPPMIIFFIFVLPSKYYRNEYKKILMKRSNIIYPFRRR
ncbi:unnamed protein product [Adineta steineri]|uniref:Uncharacterized protein n=2 Tax=Adineta steineri TaxID=433720 RepID=A0A815N9E8_9BILA|nr:unnamed protein product [Adineta steineri]